MTDIRSTPTRICQTRAWSDLGTNLHFFKDNRFTVDQYFDDCGEIRGQICTFLNDVKVAVIYIMSKTGRDNSPNVKNL